MDVRELLPKDDEENFRALAGSIQKNIWTALPVRVVADSDGHTVSVQPTVKGQQVDPTGKVSHVDMPVLHDVHVHHMSGGGVTITTPIKSGDEGIVVFSSRPLDGWAQSGGMQQQIDQRMHSLSDGFYIPGVRSDVRKLSGVSTSSTQIRSDDGNHVIDLNPGSGLSLSSAENIIIKAPDLIINGVSFMSHVHTDVRAGSDTSGPPGR